MRFDRPCRRVERALNDLAEKDRVLIVERCANRSRSSAKRNSDVEIYRCAMERRPIPVHLRSDYLNAVASALSGVRDPGDGDVRKAARKAQQQILHGPRSNGGDLLDGKTGLLTPRERITAIAARNPKFKIASGDNLGFVIGGARPK